MTDDGATPKTLAAIELIARTGAKWTQIRYMDDETPLVWVAVAGFDPVGESGRMQVAAGFTPEHAFLALLELLIDGGKCQHCGRLTAFTPHDDKPLPFDVCIYGWNETVQSYTRSCDTGIKEAG